MASRERNEHVVHCRPPRPPPNCHFAAASTSPAAGEDRQPDDHGSRLLRPHNDELHRLQEPQIRRCRSRRSQPADGDQAPKARRSRSPLPRRSRSPAVCVAKVSGLQQRRDEALRGPKPPRSPQLPMERSKNTSPLPITVERRSDLRADARQPRRRPRKARSKRTTR